MFELGPAGVHPGGVVPNHTSEYEEREYLPHDTGHHHIVANILQRRAVIGCSCNPPAGSLYDEREEVGEAEDPGVELRSDAGEIGAELESDVFEGEVYTGGDEGRGDDETTDLDFESVARPGVAVEHYSSDIAWCGCQWGK